MGLSTTERTVLGLVANTLFKAGYKPEDGVDWREVFQECKNQAVIQWGLQGAKAAAKLPEDLKREWEETAIAAAYNNIRVSWEHTWVDEIMKRAEVPYVILKGCASARYYGKPEERLMGDVDFLVKPSDVGRAGAFLEREGLAPWNGKHICHIVYTKERAHLELHFEPNGIPHGRAGELVREYLEDVMEKAEEIPWESGRIVCPSAFHHGLILLLHTSHHLLGEGIGLRHLCDWAVFAASLSDEEFRELFEEKLKRIGLWRFASILTAAAQRWLGCPARDWAAQQEEELLDDIVGEIFKSGNFGRKEAGRVYEGFLISDRGKDGVGQVSMLRQFARCVNNIVRAHWPSAGKYPALLPAGWMYFGGRYMIRILLKKRPPLHPMKMVRGAEERLRTYKKFTLFEVGDQLE